MLDETECSMPRNTLFSSTKQKSRNKIFSVTAFLILCLSKRLLFYLLQFQGFSCLKKSLPLSSTKMNAGKFSTSIFQMASIPSSGYSTHSMLLMLFCFLMVFLLVVPTKNRKFPMYLVHKVKNKMAVIGIIGGLFFFE